MSKTEKDNVDVGEQEEPDLRGPAVIADGSVTIGFRFIGPFTTVDAALKWYKESSISGLIGIKCTIVLLINPDTEGC